MTPNQTSSAPRQMQRLGSSGVFAQWDSTKCTHTVEDALSEIERESNVRMKCFDRWVSEGKMTASEAALRMGSLVSAFHFLADTDEGRQMLVANKRADIPF